jgi:hypothetical protein
MTSPWSVKGVTARTRRIAKREAQLAGITLGEFLNRLVGRVFPDLKP